MSFLSFFSEEIPLGDTRLLEEHDLTNVLNQLPVDAFNELFTTGKLSRFVGTESLPKKGQTRFSSHRVSFLFNKHKSIFLQYFLLIKKCEFSVSEVLNVLLFGGLSYIAQSLWYAIN